VIRGLLMREVEKAARSSVKRNMAESKPTVLIDTNILISGLVSSKGNEHRILKIAEDKEIVLILPRALEEAGMVFCPSRSGS
jgi:hypothetical protein